MLRVSRLPSGQPEIFASIQGEGPTRGRPSVFVRLALCNLRCEWCDTKYTWDWTHHDPSAEIMSLEGSAVVVNIEQLHHRNVVITGGEPLLQQSAIAPLLRALKRSGRRIEVETNGTITPRLPVAEHVDQWNVSPKLASSGNPIELRAVRSTLDWFAACPNAYFKLVVSGPSDWPEIEELVSAHRVPYSRVILMPEAQDPRSLAQHARWLIPACHAAGYQFSPRLQIALWGTARAR
jgi:7-carboxy-7-deazaguanine synthase